MELKFIDRTSEGQNCPMRVICEDNCTTIPMDAFVQRNLACIFPLERQNYTPPPSPYLAVKYSFNPNGLLGALQILVTFSRLWPLSRLSCLHRR